MLKTYFTVAYRNFIKNKVFSLINVLGLSIGISASLVIFLIVHYDFSFDKFEGDRSRLYRIVTNRSENGNVYHNSGVTTPLAGAIKNDLAGIDDLIAFHQSNGDPKVKIERSNHQTPLQIKHQSGVIFADDAYFRLLPYEWLAGSSHSALKEPFKVVLTEERASAYFPSLPFTSMIGRQIIYDDSLVATVTGIVKRLPRNTDFIFKEFISQSTIPANALLKSNYGWNNWNNTNGGSQLIVRLSPNVTPKTMEARIQSLETKYHTEDLDPNSKRTFALQPFDDMHFNPIYSSFGDHTANKPTLYGLLVVAVFLLALACINFINLTTAQSVQRAKEIGVRKTMGSSGKQLMTLFLTETLFITIVSMVVSILITPLLLNAFAGFIPKDLHFDLLNQPVLIGFLVILTLLVTVLAGFYPALVLSKLKPVLILKNQAYSGGSSSRKAWLRKGLTISQFLVAQVFTMATLIAVKQIHFVMNKDLGFKKDAIITVYTPSPSSRADARFSKPVIFRNKINNLPGVQMVSLAGEPPAADGWSSDGLKFTDGKKESVTDTRLKFGDTSYLKLYHIRLLAGRNVRASDTTNEFVINETFMHILGFQKPDDILNKSLNQMPIVGVMADFNQESLHTPVKPMVFASDMGNYYLLHIALKNGVDQAKTWKSTIASIEKNYKEMFPEEDFSYGFVDESIAKFYKADQNLSHLLTWAAGLAILISCMGLLGLVMYTTSLRTKEIGVRKVLGASIGQILSILSKEFIQLVLVASLLAIPVAWWAMNKWLSDFAYRAPVAWWVFAISIVGMIIIALFTLSIQTIRAAAANPVDSLRAE